MGGQRTALRRAAAHDEDFHEAKKRGKRKEGKWRTSQSIEYGVSSIGAKPEAQGGNSLRVIADEAGGDRALLAPSMIAMKPSQPLGPVKTYRDLLVWQKAKLMAVSTYRLCESPGLCRKYTLCDQMTRAAVSIASNIAEGDERSTNKESLRFIVIARASLAELETQVEIAHEIGAVSQQDVAKFRALAEELGRLIGGVIRMRQDRERLSADRS
jgi:four helix bundle protein